MPWFPKSREELDLFTGHVVMYRPGLDADHPVGVHLHWSSLTLVARLVATQRTSIG